MVTSIGTHPFVGNREDDGDVVGREDTDGDILGDGVSSRQ